MSATTDDGQVLGGKYRVLRKLGEGGMGEVLLAEHTALDQKVAVKVLHAQLAKDPVVLERFLREARAVARIASDHVVRVFDVGRFDDGKPYIVMEYLEGMDLAKRLEGGPLPSAEAIDYMLQACAAIAEAHRAGVVHRDLKPANLFLEQRRDGSSIVKVVDFGISKLSPKAGRAEASLTSTEILGSPYYMSPEQLRGDRQMDARVDIWALGAILFELVTGEGPFEASTLPEMCLRIMASPARTLTDVRPDVRFASGLQEVIDRCLAKDPQARFSDAEGLAAALMPFARRAVVAREEARAAPPRARWRWPSAIVACVVVIGVTIFGVARLAGGGKETGPSAASESVSAQVDPSATSDAPASVTSSSPSVEPMAHPPLTAMTPTSPAAPPHPSPPKPPAGKGSGDEFGGRR